MNAIKKNYLNWVHNTCILALLCTITRERICIAIEIDVGGNWEKIYSTCDKRISIVRDCEVNILKKSYGALFRKVTLFLRIHGDWRIAIAIMIIISKVLDINNKIPNLSCDHLKLFIINTFWHIPIQQNNSHLIPCWQLKQEIINRLQV